MAAVGIALWLTTAQAQQRTVYGSDGRATGRAITDSSGNVTFYDATGKVTGRASTDSQGTMTIYDAAGRSVGSITKNKK
jgi:YD repeat-containing protein